MVIKLSDYILEQSISGASIDDIGLEQLVAEMDVCCKLAMAYNKQLLMESYFQESKVIGQNPVGTGDPAASQTASAAPTPTTQTPTQSTEQQSTNQTTTQPLQQNLVRKHTVGDNQNTTNNVNSEQGFFKSIAGYIKRFFQWIGSKLTGVSADAVKNIAFIERYALNASEQQIVQFIHNNGVNIEWYNPNELKRFVDGLNNACGSLIKSLDTVDGSSEKNLDDNLKELEIAMNKFNEIIQQSSWTQSKEIVDEVNEIQTFKTNITEYAKLFENKKTNPENFVNKLNECNNKIQASQQYFDKWFADIAKVDTADNPNNNNIARMKPILSRLQNIVKSASVQINKIAEAYKKLKQFAIDISKQLQENPNDMNRGQIEKAWYTPKNAT